jgi:ABC-type cobalamin/Fe3+-siderophores transport system ATPase subunit
VALDEVSVEIEAGTICGLLGRNGAGKTTLLRILAGQEFPSAGRVSVLGASPAENEHVLRRIVREDQSLPRFQGRPRAAGRILVLPELGCRAGGHADRRLRPAAEEVDQAALARYALRPRATREVDLSQAAVLAGLLRETQRRSDYVAGAVGVNESERRPE